MWTKFFIFIGCSILTMLSIVLAKQPNEPQQSAKTPLAIKTDTSKPDPTVLRDQALRVIETYCFSCHGSKKSEGEVRFDALDSIDPVDQQKLYASAKAALQIKEMPPEKASNRTMLSALSDAVAQQPTHWRRGQGIARETAAVRVRQRRQSRGPLLGQVCQSAGFFARPPLGTERVHLQ